MEYHKPFDGTSLYTETPFGKAREFDFVDEKIVYVTPELLEKRARNRAMVEREGWRSRGIGRHIGQAPSLGELLDSIVYENVLYDKRRK